MKNNNKTNKQTHIKTIEAANIYEYMYRGISIRSNMDASIPYSLELIQLRKQGLVEYSIGKWDNELKQHEITETNELAAREMNKISKFHTDDIINVKFSRVVKDKEDTIKAIQADIKKNKERAIARGWDEEATEQYSQKRALDIEEIKNSDNENWNKSLGENLLRKEIYETGFELMNFKGELIKYVPYKRSSAKARVGNILFINEKLHDSMMDWSRMGLEIDLDIELDTPSLMAYEALVTSSIKSTIKINPKNILIVDDVASTFKTALKEVRDKDGELYSVFNPEGEISNELFDGQGLLDSSYFKNNEGMMLLRQHFFKSCVFNVNVVQFMQDQFGDEFETATIKDMFGNKIKVKDIHMITTPSSLKIFKFSDLFFNEKDNDKAFYKHWKKCVNADGAEFGVCKSESVSKRGDKLQQMSYQMINSLPTDKEGIVELSTPEVNYINELKVDNESFIKHLEATETRMNSNRMIIDLYNHNSDFALTNTFNEFKKLSIREYVGTMRKGKIRVSGDYAVMVGNPYEMLLHSIGKYDIKKDGALTLQGSQVYTKLFEANTKLVGFRNPHTSANNIYSCENVSNELLERYMNFSANIVAVNVIENPINDILSGADFDSDTVLLTDNELLVELAQSNEAMVCVNKIESKKVLRTLNNKDRATVDSAINSDLIGKVVNTGQVCQSVMYDALASGDLNRAKEAEQLLEIINVFSTIAIDLAKKSFKINVDDEYNRLSKLVQKLMKKNNEGKNLYPNFFLKKEAHQKTSYNTPMDYLIEALKEDVNRQKGLYDKVNELDLIIPCDENGEAWDLRKVNYGQKDDIIEIVKSYTSEVNRLNAMIEESDGERSDYLVEALNSAYERYLAAMSRKTVKPETMFVILNHLYEGKLSASPLKVLSALYTSSPKNFMKAIISK